jgi:hypothetical protein
MTLDEAARGLKKKAIQKHRGNFLYFLRTNDHANFISWLGARWVWWERREKRENCPLWQI